MRRRIGRIRRPGRGGDVLALEHDAPGGRRQHAQHGKPGRRLAAAALADQPERLAAADGEATRRRPP